MKWIKRFVLMTLCVIALGFLAHKPETGLSDVPPGFVTVRYWEKWVGNEGDQMRQIVDDFNNSVGLQKHIHVQYMSMTAIDQKTLVATAAGVPPDIAGVWDQQVAQYAALGAVEPLDDLAAAYGITEQTYLPVLWNGCRYNDHLYALVSTPATIALHYNKQIFRENADKLRAIGGDPERAPRTLDELNLYAAALDSRDAAGHIDRAGYVPLQSWYVIFTAYWYGGDIFNTTTQKFELTSKPMIDAYTWVQSYSQRLGAQVLNDFNSAHNVNAFDTPQNPFLTGKLVMQQQGPWMANYIAHLKPSMSQVMVPTAQEHSLPDRKDNYAWGVAPFPAAIPGLHDVTFCNFDALVIPVGARHKAEAFEFIAYVNRQDVAEKLACLHCKISPLRKVSKEFLANHPNPYIDVFQKLAASPNARGVPPVPIWPEVAKELNDAAQAVAIQGASPTAVLQATQDRLQKIYDRFRTTQERRDQLAQN